MHRYIVRLAAFAVVVQIGLQVFLQLNGETLNYGAVISVLIASAIISL